MSARSYLFVPADRPERIAKALASGADAVIVDLEDAVAPPAKATARHALAQWLDDQARSGDASATESGATNTGAIVPLFVRVNATSTAWCGDDLRLCAHPCIQGVVVPKAQTHDDLAVVHAAAPGRVLLPLIETALGMQAAASLTSCPGVERLAFGSLDFALDLGLEAGDDEGDQALLAFRSQLVLVSRAGGLAAPVDGVSPTLDDEAIVLRDTVRARRLGFGAKLCIHPRQVGTVHRGFAPTETEMTWARRVLQAFEAAQADSACGAIAVDGKMIDAPVLRRAESILERAGTV